MKMKKNLETNVVPANPVELMAGWLDLMRVNCTITWAFGLMVMFRMEQDILFSIFTVTLSMVLWFPAGIAALVFDSMKERLAKMSGVYASAGSVFSDGIRQGIKRCLYLRLNNRSGRFVAWNMVMILIIIVCNVCSLFVPDVWVAAIAVGSALSLFGFFVIGTCLLYDYFNEARRWRQLI